MQYNANGSETARAPSSAEQLLAELMSDEESYAAYRDEISRAMFQDKGWLYDTLERLHASEGISTQGVLLAHPDSMSYLVALFGYGFNARRIPQLIEAAKKDLVRTRVRTAAQKIAWDSHDEDLDANELLAEAQQQLLGIEQSSSEHGLADPEKDINEYFDGLMEIVDDPSKAFGMLSGMRGIDDILLGFKRQDFSVAGARTSMGKSAFAAQLAVNLTIAGYKVAYFSLEMSKKQLYNRMFANVMDADAEFFTMGKLHRRFYDEARAYIALLKEIYIDDTRGVDANYIADKVRRLKKKRGVDFVIVDYLQDVSEKGEHNDNSGSAIARICRKLRVIAQESDCHVLGLSQVIRAVEDRNDKRPLISDLSGSTGIETAADLIMMLYRDEYYNPNTATKNMLEVNVGKHRNGKLGLAKLHYDKSTQKIR